MSEKKGTPTPRRKPLAETTIHIAQEIVFNTLLQRHIAERNWSEVEDDFRWYGRFLESEVTGT